MKAFKHPSLAPTAHSRWGLLVSMGALVAIGACRQDGSPSTAPVIQTPASTETSAVPAKGQVAVPSTPKAAATAKSRPTADRIEVPSTRPSPVPTAAKEPTSFPPFKGKTIAIVHTANMVGEIEPCG